MPRPCGGALEFGLKGLGLACLIPIVVYIVLRGPVAGFVVAGFLESWEGLGFLWGLLIEDYGPYRIGVTVVGALVHRDVVDGLV